MLTNDVALNGRSGICYCENFCSTFPKDAVCLFLSDIKYSQSFWSEREKKYPL